MVGSSGRVNIQYIIPSAKKFLLRLDELIRKPQVVQGIVRQLRDGRPRGPGISKEIRSSSGFDS